MAGQKEMEVVKGKAKQSGGLFSAEQLLRSEKYRDRRDILTALLKPGERYTFSDVEKMVGDYMKGKVK